MAGSGSQQASPPHAESVNVSQPNGLPNLERENHVDNQQEGILSKIIPLGFAYNLWKLPEPHSSDVKS